MAIENNTPQKSSPVFVVKTKFASPNRIDDSHEISDQKREINFTYPKEIRNKISVIRERYMGQIRNNTLDFPSNWDNPLWLCNEEQMKWIKTLVKQAEDEFAEIDKLIHKNKRELHAEILFLELNIYDVQRGELYGQVISAIRYRILSEVIEKIGEKVGQLPKNSKEAMLKLIERLKSVNVLNDPEVEKQLEAVRENIMTKDIEIVRSELVQELNYTKSRMTYVEL